MKQVLLVIRLMTAGNFLSIKMGESEACDIIDRWQKGLLKDGFLHDKEFPKPRWALKVDQIQLMHVQDPAELEKQQKQQQNQNWLGKSGMN